MAGKKRFPKCICGHDEYEVIHKGDWVDKEGKLNFSILQCLNCGLQRNFPVPKPRAATDEEIEFVAKNLALWESFGENLIQLIGKYKEKKKLRVLDIGSGIGVFVKLAKEKGWHSTGIDIDKKVVNFGRRRFNVDLRWTSLENAKFPPGEFDTVVLSHVLEHLALAQETLKEIKRILNPDGILVIVVPNIEGLPPKLQKILRRSWYGFDPRHHLWHFTPKTLYHLLKEEGFKILKLHARQPLHYLKTGSFWDIPRDLLLKLIGFLNMGDQITLVATSQK